MKRRVLLSLLALGVVLVFAVGCSGEADEPVTDDATETSTPADDATEEPAEPAEFTLTSSAYEDGGQIAPKYCNVGVEDGENVSIPLSWEGVPEGTMSFALIVVDHHEVANEWVHWMVTGIPATTTSLAEGASGSMPTGTTELLSTNGEAGYQGPQPPPGSGDHEYETIIFALDTESVDVPEGATFGDFLDAMDPHHLGEAYVSGYFGR